MKYIDYNKNTLNCENVEITKIIEEFDTPLYIYSSSVILDNFNQYKKAFSKHDPIICFAMKANSNLGILHLLKEAGAGVDIVSGGELFKAIDTGINPKKIVFSGVGKTDNEIEAALHYDILILNAESYEEIIRINSIAGKQHKKACITIRVNPDVNPKTHPYISTGLKKNKFGIDIKDIKNFIKDVVKLPNISLIGLHFHIGSQLINLSPIHESIQKLKILINELEKENINIKYLNIGGGLGIKYNDEIEPTPQSFIQLITPLLKDFKCKLIIEPGRSIVGNAGMLVTKVLYTKINNKKKFIIVDAGMNDLIRPSFYDAYHKIIPIKKSLTNKNEVVDIVGPICETGDFFARDRKLPTINQGDTLAILSSGAYGFSMSSNYNSRARVAEVLVKDTSFHLIRRRETYNELVLNEKNDIIPFSKLSGSGNDFIIIDNRKNLIKKNSLSTFTKQMCTPKHGIGADGVIFIENSKYTSFLMRIFNLDGSEAEMCGNGARCCVKYVYDKKLVLTNEVKFETKSGILFATIDPKTNLVKLKMQNPTDLKIDFKIDGIKHKINFINTGVPHAVIFVDNFAKIDAENLGHQIRNNKYFLPNGTNVNFVEIYEKNKINIKTYERGVEGITLACGTGATAAALIYALFYKVKSPIKVVPPSQDMLTIYYSSSHNSFNDVYLEGNAKLIFDGYYYSNKI